MPAADPEVFDLSACICCGGPCIPCFCCGEIEGQPASLSYADVMLPYIPVCGFDDGCDNDCGFEQICTLTPGLWRKYNELFANVSRRINQRTSACTLLKIFGPFDYDAVTDTAFCTGNAAGVMWVDIVVFVESDGGDLCRVVVNWIVRDGADYETAVQYHYSVATDWMPFPLNCNAGYTADFTHNPGPCGMPYEEEVEISLAAVACSEEP